MSTRRSREIAALGLAVLVLLGCGGGTRLVVLGTARAPSTSGVIEVDDVSGGHTLVAIHMEHLHPPERLEEGLTSYVVWFEDSGKAVRAGVLEYDPDNRTGDLSGTSDSRKFTVKITAEQKSDAAQPSDFVIAQKDIAID
jgi:hypothetical protein